MNVGFVEARAHAYFDCFIFHDVDMLPQDDRNFYACSAQPRHVGSHVNKWSYKYVHMYMYHIICLLLQSFLMLARPLDRAKVFSM